LNNSRNLLSESSVDTTLSGDSVRSCGEKLRDTGSVETGFRKTEGGTQTGTTSTDDDGIVLVVLQQSELFSHAWPQSQWLTMTGYLSEM
jgi:hypothetical protein